MSMQDPISDMLTRIRNAHHRSKPDVVMPSSKLKASLAKVLQDEGYISGFSVSDEVKPSLTVELKYFEGKPAIKEIKRASKPGLRLYSSSNDMPLNYGGLGISIVSTSNGLMSDHEARNANIGGEILCSVF